MREFSYEDKIKEQFHYFSIHAGIDSVYGIGLCLWMVMWLIVYIPMPFLQSI